MGFVDHSCHSRRRVIGGNSVTKRQVSTGQPVQMPPTGDEEVRREIALLAYYRYRERGSAPGFELEDWLAAEREVLARRANAEHPSSVTTASKPRSRRGAKQPPARP